MPQGAEPSPAVIVCHPHPLYGGSMDNNVVHNVCHTLTRASFVSFRFNFRGVGRSQGEFSQGIGEQQDVEAAISFLIEANGVDPGQIGLAGYSAGAAFALPVGVNDDRIKALAAISPPLDTFEFDFIKHCPKPRFFASGSADNYTPADEFLGFCRSLSEPKQCELIKGADHFWVGYESRLSTLIGAFFAKAFRPSPS